MSQCVLRIKKIAEYGYEFNDGDQIWSDTAEIYKTDNDSLFIKKI